jgi:hypothetical protein
MTDHSQTVMLRLKYGKEYVIELDTVLLKLETYHDLRSHLSSVLLISLDTTKIIGMKTTAMKPVTDETLLSECQVQKNGAYMVGI